MPTPDMMPLALRARKSDHGQKEKHPFEPHRTEPKGAPRLHHRGDPRSRHRAGGVGGEKPARRKSAAARQPRRGQKRRGLALRGAYHPLENPPPPTSTPTPSEIAKLLLHGSEISRLIGAVERRGYTLVALDMHWKHGRAKALIALAKGKKQHDKRAAAKGTGLESREIKAPAKRLKTPPTPQMSPRRARITLTVPASEDKTSDPKTS